MCSDVGMVLSDYIVVLASTLVLGKAMFLASCTSLSRPGTFFIVFQKFDRANALEWAPGAGGLAIAPCVDVKFVVPYVFAQGNCIAPFLPRDEIIDG